MDVGGFIVLTLTGVGLLCVPRKWVLGPLLIGCLFLLKSQAVDLGGISLKSHHMLLAIGVLRLVIKGEKLEGPLLPVDKLVLLWGGWMLFASLFHSQADGSGFVYTAGSVFTICSTYFLTRTWCRNFDEVRTAAALIALCLVPVAVGMMIEKVGAPNPFIAIGAVGETVIRDGIIRSRGPFRHPILAGTVGAAFFPLMIGIWRSRPTLAIIGVSSCLVIVVMSHSSGPLLSFLFGTALMFGWKYRQYAGKAVKYGILGYLLIEVISNRPAYHAIVTRLDMTGSSTAYYRARLIDTTVAHFNEWWMFGTDRTSHWIPSGIGSKILGGAHMDITNYYIAFGVNGGLISMLLLIVIIALSIKGLVQQANSPMGVFTDVDKFCAWSIAACLGSLALSALSVAFFDQSSGVIWIMLGLAVSFAASAPEREEMEWEEDSVDDSPDYEMREEVLYDPYPSR